VRGVRRLVTAGVLALALFIPAAATAHSGTSRSTAKEAIAQPLVVQADAWLSTRSQAQGDLRGRFKNINGVNCSPDRSSATDVIGNYRYWQRFWCQGRTYDRVAFRLLLRNTGQCSGCWTIGQLTGTSVSHLRVRHRTRPSGGSPASCPSDYYRNVSGHCVHRPSSDPTGATAVCNDGTYSYSEHASGTCSHHGGVARWINHP
jgi:hypothetical protein